jgi:hypothetical protein
MDGVVSSRHGPITDVVSCSGAAQWAARREIRRLHLSDRTPMLLPPASTSPPPSLRSAALLLATFFSLQINWRM